MSENRWGRRSLQKREMLYGPLAEVCDTILQRWDCGIWDTYRNEEEQEAHYRAGRSRAHYGESAHNVVIDGKPSSMAVHLVPTNILLEDVYAAYSLLRSWKRKEKTMEFMPEMMHRYFKQAMMVTMFIGMVMEAGEQAGLTLVTGLDWDGDRDMLNNRWDDIFHLEIKDWRTRQFGD